MRKFAATLFAVLALSACSRHTPPQGRWEGTLDRPDAMVAARVEIDSDGVRIMAPNAEDVGYDEDARTSMRTSLAGGLAAGWEKVEPRKLEFDGHIFRRPGGIAPQMEWDEKKKRMSLVVYLGKKSGITFPLHAVDDFSSDPWPPS